MGYSTSISVILPTSYREQLDQLAREKSVVEGRSVSLCEIVRSALETTYGLADSCPETGPCKSKQKEK